MQFKSTVITRRLQTVKGLYFYTADYLNPWDIAPMNRSYSELHFDHIYGSPHCINTSASLQWLLLSTCNSEMSHQCHAPWEKFDWADAMMEWENHPKNSEPRAAQAACPFCFPWAIFPLVLDREKVQFSSCGSHLLHTWQTEGKWGSSLSNTVMCILNGFWSFGYIKAT